MNNEYQLYLEGLDEEIKKARSNQNALDYFHKCNEAGLEPEDILLYEQGQVDARLCQGGLERVVGKPRKKRKTKRTRKIPEERIKKYKLFVKKTNQQELNPDAIFMYSGEKRSLLREVMSYTQLKTEKGRTPLDECSDSQIGKTFRNIYNTGLRAINQ